MDVIDELIAYCEAWEPWARVMGNVCAGDAAQALRSLRAELSASREDAERYRHLLREAYVFGRTTPDVHNLPNEPVSLWLHSTVPLDVEGINGIVDAARKGEGE